MNLKKVVPRAGRRHFHEVQTDRAATTRWDGQGVKQARGAAVLRLDALACRAGANEGVDVGDQ
jgi:hypothetical protein